MDKWWWMVASLYSRTIIFLNLWDLETLFQEHVKNFLEGLGLPGAYQRHTEICFGPIWFYETLENCQAGPNSVGKEIGVFSFLCFCSLRFVCVSICFSSSTIANFGLGTYCKIVFDLFGTFKKPWNLDPWTLFITKMFQKNPENPWNIFKQYYFTDPQKIWTSNMLDIGEKRGTENPDGPLNKTMKILKWDQDLAEGMKLKFGRFLKP